MSMCDRSSGFFGSRRRVKRETGRISADALPRSPSGADRLFSEFGCRNSAARSDERCMARNSVVIGGGCAAIKPCQVASSAFAKAETIPDAGDPRFAFGVSQAATPRGNQAVSPQSHRWSRGFRGSDKPSSERSAGRRRRLAGCSGSGRRRWRSRSLRGRLWPTEFEHVAGIDGSTEFAFLHTGEKRQRLNPSARRPASR